MLDFFGKLPSHSVRAQVWELDGELAAFAGYYMHGTTAVVFSDIKPDLDVPAITIVRQAIAYLSDLPVDAICSAEDERAEMFLERLGWKHAATTEEGEIYAWQH